MDPGGNAEQPKPAAFDFPAVRDDLLLGQDTGQIIQVLFGVTAQYAQVEPLRETYLRYRLADQDHWADRRDTVDRSGHDRIHGTHPAGKTNWGPSLSGWPPVYVESGGVLL